MTKEEASERYQIPLKILQEYENWNLCGEVKTGMGAWQYDDQDLERLGMIMTLHQTGFDQKEIREYMELYLAGEETAAERMRILKEKRDAALDEIHFQEKKYGKIWKKKNGYSRIRRKLLKFLRSIGKRKTRKRKDKKEALTKEPDSKGMKKELENERLSWAEPYGFQFRADLD